MRAGGYPSKRRRELKESGGTTLALGAVADGQYFKDVDGSIVGASDVATVTTAALHLYADGTSGSDANDGLSVGAPKKTLQAAINLIPAIVSHLVVVHMSGVFDEQGDAVIEKQVTYNGVILFDGGTDTTAVDDNGGSHYTTSGSSVSSLIVAGAGWTDDEHAGYWVKVLTGPAAGQIALVQKNNATTITPQKNFSVDPGTGATFDIVRPATTWQASTANAFIRPNVAGIGLVAFQRLTLAGSKAAFNAQFQCTLRFAGIVSTSTLVNAFYFYRSLWLAFSSTLWDPEASSLAALASPVIGTGILGTGKLNLTNISKTDLQGLVNIGTAPALTDCGFGGNAISQGSRFKKGLSLTSCRGNTSAVEVIRNSSGYAVTTFDGSTTSGLTLVNCDVSMDGGTFENNTVHGMEVQRSSIVMDGAIAGTGNGSYGVYAYSNSVVHIKNGTPPTLTGASGDFLAGATAGAWAGVDGGTPVADASEFTLVKEV